MDEIEYKLNTNNSVLVVNAIEKLISAIKSKYKPAERQKFALENEELKFLRQKCSSKNTMVSLTACQGLLALVELGVLEIAHTMSTVVTLLPSAHNYSAIITTMAGLLILDLKSRLVPGQPYKCQFNLKSPQHPFITVLARNSDAEDNVLPQMNALCNHPDYIVSSNSLELLKPVFLWLTSRPERPSSGKPWQLLLSLPESPAQEAMLLACISCQQISNPMLLPSTFAAYSAVVEAAVYRRQWDLVEALLPNLARIANEQVLAGQDPRACYTLVARAVNTLADNTRAAPLVLLLLATNLTTSSALYLHELFNLCLNIASKFECSVLSFNTFVALSLQWLHLPSYLTSAALKTAAQIVDKHKNNTKEDTLLVTPNLKSNKTFRKLLHTDRKLSVTFKLYQTWEKFRDNPTKLESWLQSLMAVDSDLKLELLPFLLGLLMEKNREDFDTVKVLVLRIVVDLVDVKKDVAVVLLPVLIFKIINDKSPTIKLECLKAVPLMAKSKENVPTVISFLNKLKVGKGVPTSFLIMLYTRLAEIQVRCFPYLKEVLIEGGPSRNDDLKWEIDLAKATAVQRICELRPTSQGVELVSTISGLLSRCGAAGAAAAAAAAVRALRALCRAAAVSAASAWKRCAARLQHDTRPKLQISVCELLSEIPSLRVSSAEYDALLASTASVLWTFVAESHDPAVIEAACDALACYKHTDYTLKEIPEIYKSTVKLPAAYCKTPVDAERKPEDVLDYIPCEVWAEVFRHTAAAGRRGVRRLAARLLAAEVAAYRSGVYLHAAREPPAPAALPVASRVRGLLAALVSQARSPTYDFPDAALLSLLISVGGPLPRPLPPLDLCFLHELCHRSQEWKFASLTLAARQAQTSGSGRRLVENFLAGVTPGETPEDEILFIFDILPIICKGLPPNSIREPVVNSLAHYYSLISHMKDRDGRQDNEDHVFVKLLIKIKECLDCDKIHQANFTLMCQIVESYYSIISDDHISWPTYTDVCTSLSSECLERMTSPSGWWEATGEGVRKAFAVRAAVAATGALVWLNEVLDVQATEPSGQEQSLKCVYNALRCAKSTDVSTAQWFLQLMARTQVAFKEMEDNNAKLYMCDVLCLSVVVLSGHWSFEPDTLSDRRVRLEAFPPAVATLFSLETWKEYTLQMLEWLSHTRDSVPDAGVSESCQLSLLAMRHAPHFLTHNIWIRLESHFGKQSATPEE